MRTRARFESRHKNLLLLAIGIGLALLTPWLLHGVNALGWRIQQTDRASDYLNGLCVAIALGLFLTALPFKRNEKKVLLTLWVVKCVLGLVFMLFYEWNYGLDAYYYFEMSQIPLADFSNLGFGRGTQNMVALLWTLEHHVFSTHSYHAQKMILSFVGLAGVFALYRGLRAVSSRVTPGLLLMIGLFPSVLFWSSILGKDPINLFSNCLFIYGVCSYYGKRRPIYLIVIAVALLLAALIRVWLVPVLVLPLVFLQISKIRHLSTKFVLFGGLFFAGTYCIRYLGQALSLENAEAVVSGVNYISKSWNTGGSATDVPELGSIGAVLKFLPIGMFTALFRPLPGEVLNIFGLFAGVENVFLIYLAYRSVKNYSKQTEARDIAILALGFVLLWSTLYAFISPQNLGAAVRFRLQVLPVMLALLLHLAYPPKRPTADIEIQADSSVGR